MKLPKTYDYAEAYLTFNCNLSCDYCINKSGGLEKRKELTAEQWTKGLNKINFDIPLTLGGGEPTKHPEFFEILDGLRRDTKIDLLTNLSFDVDEFIKKTNPKRFSNSDNPAYRSIRASFHPTGMELEETINKAVKLQEAGFSIGLFSINHPANVQGNMQMSESARKNQIYFFIGDFLGKDEKGKLHGFYKYPEALDGNKKEALCKTSQLLISPNGDTHKCHRDLYLNKHPLNNILDNDFKVKDRFRKCINYGTCNPCDIKLRTNRFLQMGNCNVEII